MITSLPEIADLERLLRATAPITTAMVLAAVARNFALARGSGPVAREQRSVVATASMLAFFGGVYLLIHHHIGTVILPHSPARIAFETAGALLMGLGATVNILGRRTLGRNWADQATLYTDQSLVTAGVFRIARHPLYASLIWMFYGAALLHQNIAVAAATTLIFVPGMYWRAAIEERLLAERFPAYDAYRRRVGMLFPKPPRRWSDGLK